MSCLFASSCNHIFFFEFDFDSTFFLLCCVCIQKPYWIIAVQQSIYGFKLKYLNLHVNRFSFYYNSTLVNLEPTTVHINHDEKLICSILLKKRRRKNDWNSLWIFSQFSPRKSTNIIWLNNNASLTGFNEHSDERKTKRVRIFQFNSIQ